jgi:hypothetical protein
VFDAAEDGREDEPTSGAKTSADVQKSVNLDSPSKLLTLSKFNDMIYDVTCCSLASRLSINPGEKL